MTHLTDETGAAVRSEKMIELEWYGSRATRLGDQFGLGRVTE